MSNNENFIISSLNEEILAQINMICTNIDLSMTEMIEKIKDMFDHIKFNNGELNKAVLIRKIKQVYKLELEGSTPSEGINKHPFYSLADNLSKHIYNNHIDELLSKFTKKALFIEKKEIKQENKKNIFSFLFFWRKRKDTGGFVNGCNYEDIPF